MTFKYDYVVIDTRNDSNIITNNMLTASDLVLGVSTVQVQMGLKALLGLECILIILRKELVDVFLGKVMFEQPFGYKSNFTQYRCFQTV
ncbi:AAA family ATPase [Enterococcus gallinarum]|nr:AAA family ATPase [Enterococcus gallinarum]